MFESDKTWRVNLADGYKAQGMLCENKVTDKNSKCDSKAIINGKWSPIYS